MEVVSVFSQLWHFQKLPPAFCSCGSGHSVKSGASLAYEQYRAVQIYNFYLLFISDTSFEHLCQKSPSVPHYTGAHSTEQ